VVTPARKDASRWRLTTSWGRKEPNRVQRCSGDQHGNATTLLRLIRSDSCAINMTDQAECRKRGSAEQSVAECARGGPSPADGGRSPRFLSFATCVQ